MMSVLIRNNFSIFRPQLTFISFPTASAVNFQAYDLQTLCISTESICADILFFFLRSKQMYVASVRNHSSKSVCRPNLLQCAVRHNPQLLHLKPVRKWQAIFYIYGCLVVFNLFFVGVRRGSSIFGNGRPQTATRAVASSPAQRHYSSVTTERRAPCIGFLASS